MNEGKAIPLGHQHYAVPEPNESYARLMAQQGKAKLLFGEPVTDLRAAREKLGLTQAALAEKLGMDAPRLSLIENGKPMPPYLDLAMRVLLAQ